jgi:hypothetical protein
MRLTNKKRRFGVPAMCWIVIIAAVASAQDRGTLVVTTYPDSATVVLDDSKDAERQHTPFTNESMIPGSHTVILRPADPAYKSVRLDVNIEAGQTATLEHTFEYRTMAYGMEMLSVAPWKFEVATGIEALRYIGLEAEKADPKAPAIPKSYPTDSIPNSLHFPVNFRLGFPGGWELHFSAPIGSKSIPKPTSTDKIEGFNPSDPGFGVKWTYAPLNSAIDIAWTFGSTKKLNLGTQANALSFTAITNQKWESFDLAGNLGLAVRMANLTDSDKKLGARLSAKVRGGMLLADRFMPAAQVNANFTLPTKVVSKNDSEITKASFQVGVTPQFIWYAGQNLSLELGVPLTLLASNEETSWGFQAGLAWDFSLATKRQASARKKGAALSAYPLQSPGVPVNSTSNILFDGKEVSNAEYKEFCDKTGREYPADPEFTGMPGYFADPKYGAYPVVKISIDDARAYATWVNKRLPTVTEWRKEIENAPLVGNMVACGLESPEPAGTRHQGSGIYNMVGNVAEWVENDRKVGSVAYIAGGFFSLPRERCLDKGRWIDVASPAGAKYIGMRLVTEVK